jgi:DNA-directed RNA polymerase specialized sigma24 family protein
VFPTLFPVVATSTEHQWVNSAKRRSPRTGRHYAADTTLWNSQLDLGKMNMRWVAETKDPLFARLSRYQRQILYLYFSQERTWKDIAKICRKCIKTVQDDYLKVLGKIRNTAGVSNPIPTLSVA